MTHCSSALPNGQWKVVKVHRLIIVSGRVLLRRRISLYSSRVVSFHCGTIEHIPSAVLPSNAEPLLISEASQRQKVHISFFFNPVHPRVRGLSLPFPFQRISSEPSNFMRSGSTDVLSRSDAAPVKLYSVFIVCSLVLIFSLLLKS